MIVLSVFAMTLAFFVLGYGLARWVLNRVGSQEIASSISEAKRSTLLAPALAATVLGAFIHSGQFATHALLWIPAGLLIAGLVALSGYYVWIDRSLIARESRLFLSLGAAVSVLVALPFVLHVAPPDVDSMAFGYFGFLMKSGLGFPRATPWLSEYSSVVILATDANSALAVALSTLTGLDLAAATMTMTCFWLVATMLIGRLIIDLILKGRPTEILACLLLGLVFNRATIWEYGDGSYARVSATAAMFLCFYLCALGPQSGRGKSVLWALLVGTIHGSVLYFHYRLFIWNTGILGTWLLLDVARHHRDRLAWLRLVLLPATSAILLLPMLWILKSNPTLLAQRTVSPMFAAKHEIPWSDLGAMFLRFNGWLLPLISVGGTILAARAKLRVARLALIHFAIMAFFCFDALVLKVAPWSYNLLYSQMAIISNFALIKLTLGSIFLVAVQDRVAPLLLGKRERAAAFILGVVAIAVLYSGINHEIDNSSPQFQFQFGVFGTEYWYALVSLVCAALAATTVLLRKNTAVLYLLLPLLFANEWQTARFNYPYLAPGDREAFEWLKQNTNAQSTLVLNYSAQDIDEDLETANSKLLLGNARRAGIADYRTHWLPIFSERASIFHRGNLVSRFAGGSFVPLGPNRPDFAELDRAYFHLGEREACTTVVNAQVTHVYVPGAVRSRGDQFDTSPCLQLEFESHDRRELLLNEKDLNRLGAAIYSVKRVAL